MIQSWPRTTIRVVLLLSLALLLAVLFPLTTFAKPQTLSCTKARLQIEQTQEILRPLQERQQLLQELVRSTYQKLFSCKSGREFSIAPQQCDQLQKNGPKQFQTMVEAITLRHQISQQLANHTRQAQLICQAQIHNITPTSTLMKNF